MPYIICVNQPGYLPEADPYAVATLDEAREAAQAAVEGNLPDESRLDISGWLLAARALPESGGIVGPLPDGYVIDVRHVSWDELARLARLAGPAGTSDVLDAYNNAYLDERSRL